jgi:hypothetical protein
MKKHTVKVAANLACLFLAISFGVLFWHLYNNRSLIDEIGVSWINEHKQDIDSETRNLLSLIEVGELKSAEKTLNRKWWRKIQYGHRGYDSKRKVLFQFCEQLRRNKEYEKLQYWSSVWKEMHDRDLDAIAYWLESLRHNPDRRLEGEEGLVKESQRFPKNILLSDFLISSYKESGKLKESGNLIKEQKIYRLSNAINNWQIFWKNNDGEKHFESKILHLSQLDDETKTFRISVPDNIQILRIDPPRFEKLRIVNLVLVTKEKQSNVNMDTLVLNQISNLDNALYTSGLEDPYFQIDLGQYETLKNASQVYVEFKLSYFIAEEEQEILSIP